jgi:UrcA family protein
MNTFIATTGLRGLIATAMLGALASSFSAVSAADINPKSTSQTVKFADLNISNPLGAAALYARIQLAAQSVCSFYVFKSDAAENGCINDAIASAVSKVNQPALFAVYNAKNKTPLPTALVSQSR